MTFGGIQEGYKRLLDVSRGVISDFWRYPGGFISDFWKYPGKFISDFWKYPVGL